MRQKEKKKTKDKSKERLKSKKKHKRFLTEEIYIDPVTKSQNLFLVSSPSAEIPDSARLTADWDQDKTNMNRSTTPGLGNDHFKKIKTISGIHTPLYSAQHERLSFGRLDD